MFFAYKKLIDKNEDFFRIELGGDYYIQAYHEDNKIILEAVSNFYLDDKDKIENTDRFLELGWNEPNESNSNYFVSFEKSSFDDLFTTIIKTSEIIFNVDDINIDMISYI